LLHETVTLVRVLGVLQLWSYGLGKYNKEKTVAYLNAATVFATE